MVRLHAVNDDVRHSRSSKSRSLRFDHIYGWHTVPIISGTVTVTHFWNADAGANAQSSLGALDDLINTGDPFPNGWQKVKQFWSMALGHYARGTDETENEVCFPGTDMCLSGIGQEGAYHFLGHIAHHIGDNTIPTHAHVSAHDPFSGDDSFEDWMSQGANDRLSGLVSSPGSDLRSGERNKLRQLAYLPIAGGNDPFYIPELSGPAISGVDASLRELYWLLYTTNQIADFFPSDRARGDTNDPLEWVRVELANMARVISKPRRTEDLEDNDGVEEVGICIPGTAGDFDNNEDGDLGVIREFSYLRGIRAIAGLYKLFHDTVSAEPLVSRVTDNDSLTNIDQATVTVSNVAPTLTATGTVVDENGVATVSGTIADPGSRDTFGLTIDWGDGAPVSFSRPAGATSFSVSHQYLDDDPTGTPNDIYAIAVNVTDDDGGTGTANPTVKVNNVPPIASIDAVVDEAGNVIGQVADFVLAGLGLHLSSSFTDVGTRDTQQATIDWGDWAHTVLAAAFSPLSGGHAYEQPGSYPATVSVTDDDTGGVTVSRGITVLDGAGAVTNVADKLRSIANDPNLTPNAAKALRDAADKLLGDLPRLGTIGASGLFVNGNPDAALTVLTQTIELLLATDLPAAVPVLISQLVLTAKATALGALKQAHASGPTASALFYIGLAEQHVATGNQRLTQGEAIAALAAYRNALRNTPRYG